MPTIDRERSVIDYYEQTERHYREIWGLDRYMSLHYGYRGRGVRNHGESLDGMNAFLAEVAAVRPGDRVLDAGCGVGGSAIHLARHRGCQVVGINVVDRQLQIARENAERCGVAERIELREANFLETGLDAGSFDVAWYLESSCHAPDKRRLIAEAYRLLRPGGRMIVADFFRSAESFEPARERTVRTMERGWAIPRFATTDEFAAQMREVGFTVSRCEDITAEVSPSARRLYYLSFFGITVKTIRRLWRRSSPVKFANVWAARSQEIARRQGLWRYCVLAGVKP